MGSPYYSYTPGLGNTNSYIGAANPFLTSSNITGSDTNNGEIKITFPKVTRNVSVANTGTGVVLVHFDTRANADVINHGSFVQLPSSGDAWIFNVRTKEIYVSMATNTGTGSFSLSAELTVIPAQDMPSHSGSGINS